jgi:hypothetical protein
MLWSGLMSGRTTLTDFRRHYLTDQRNAHRAAVVQIVGRLV